MIHDRDYYSIVDKDNILLLLYEIDQNIIWACNKYFIWDNIILPISLGQDTDTSTYMEEISGRNIAQARRPKEQK